MNELAKRWDGIAADLHKWSSPLKPSQEDFDTIQVELRRWRAYHYSMCTTHVALLGVTQEITDNRWTLPGVTISAYDISPVMVATHGLQNDRVTSKVRDWFTLADDGQKYNAVLGDGSFVFYGPEKARELAQVIDKILTPTGIYIGRHFVLPPDPALLNELFGAFKMGAFETIEEFKFRVAMSLQPSSADGVVLGHVYDVVHPMRDQLLERYGAEAVSTLDHYKGSEGRLYFPTWTRIRDLFSFAGYRVRALFPSYDFGECCPTIVATRE